MLKSMLSKKDRLKERYKEGNVLQKGFTLVEILAVVVIIIILLALVVASFSFFGRVDGTELMANAKQVESAVLQKSLVDPERAIQGLAVKNDAVYVGEGEDEGEVPTRSNTSEGLVSGVDSGHFHEADQAAYVIDELAKTVGLDGEGLVELIRPVDPAVQGSIAGKAKIEEDSEPMYYVVLKKSQLYKGDALDKFKHYNDSLAGVVFSRDTVVDSDNIYYNGSNSFEGSGDEVKGMAGKVFEQDGMGNGEDE